MISTITALVAFMTTVQLWMPTFEPGRTWAVSVSAKITDAQLTAALAPCCRYVMNADGTILRVGNLVWMVNGR